MFIAGDQSYRVIPSSTLASFCRETREPLQLLAQTCELVIFLRHQVGFFLGIERFLSGFLFNKACRRWRLRSRDKSTAKVTHSSISSRSW